MTFKYQTTNFDSATLLPYLIPKALKSQNLYEAFIRSRKKKEVDLEFKTLQLSKTEQRMNLLKRLENRFDVFKKGLPSNGQSYTFRFKSLENGSGISHFSDRKNRLKNLSSYIFAYNARKYLLMNNKNRLQTRFLASTKNRCKLSFSGQPVVLNVKRKRKVSHNLKVISNLKKIGLLNFCYLDKWKLDIFKKFPNKRSTVDGEKEISYYKDLYIRSLLFVKKGILNKRSKKMKSEVDKLKIKKERRNLKQPKVKKLTIPQSKKQKRKRTNLKLKIK
jgi:hypothetical protein